MMDEIVNKGKITYYGVSVHKLSDAIAAIQFPNVNNLCLAGGCAQNSLANGKITSKSNFSNVWVQPAAGDAGGAVGAALYVSNSNNSLLFGSLKFPGLFLLSKLKLNLWKEFTKKCGRRLSD